MAKLKWRGGQAQHAADSPGCERLKIAPGLHIFVLESMYLVENHERELRPVCQQRVAREKERMESASNERRGVQGHYIRGQGYLGEAGSGHQTKLALRPFTEVEAPIFTRPPTPYPVSPAPPKRWWRSCRSCVIGPVAGTSITATHRHWARRRALSRSCAI